MNLLLLASALFVCATTFVSNPVEISFSNEEALILNQFKRRAL